MENKLTLRRGSRPAHSSLSKNPKPGTLIVSSTASLRTLHGLPTLSPIMVLLHHVQLKMPSAILASGHGNRRSEKWSVSAGLGRVLPHSQSSIFSGKRKTVSEQKCKPLASLHKIVRKSTKTREYLEEKNASKVAISGSKYSLFCLSVGSRRRDNGNSQSQRIYIHRNSLHIFLFRKYMYFREYIFQRMYISENICSPQFSRYFPFHPFPQYT